MNRKTFFGLIILLSVATISVLVSYGEKGANDVKQTIGKADAIQVRLGTFLNAIDYAPYIIAKKNGWFQESLSSLNATVIHAEPFQSPPPINEAFATNQIDAVLTAEVPSIIGKARGIDVEIVWLSCILNSEIVIPVESKISSVNDLKGKRITGLAGTSPHFGLMKNLEMSGISPEEVEFLDMPPPEAKAAFNSRIIDGWAIWPPFVEQEIVAGKGKVLPGLISPVQVVLAMRGDFRKVHPEVANKIILVYQRGKEWLIKNPEKAQEIVAAELRLPIQVVQMAWPKLDWNVKVDGGVIANIQEKADFLMSNGFIKGSVNVEKDLIRLSQ